MGVFILPDCMQSRHAMKSLRSIAISLTPRSGEIYPHSMPGNHVYFVADHRSDPGSAEADGRTRGARHRFRKFSKQSLFVGVVPCVSGGFDMNFLDNVYFAGSEMLYTRYVSELGLLID